MKRKRFFLRGMEDWIFTVGKYRIVHAKAKRNGKVYIPHHPAYHVAVWDGDESGPRIVLSGIADDDFAKEVCKAFNDEMSGKKKSDKKRRLFI